MNLAVPAAAVQQHELLLYFTLLELAVIVLAGRLGGWAARRVRQSAAVGEFLIGIMLGPSLFGWVAFLTSNRGRSAITGIFHGSDPLAM